MKKLSHYQANITKNGDHAMKLVFVTGGVMSGLGKGVVASSIAKLYQLSGKTVTCVKLDPYLNYDAGMMNPIQHGEVFVTKDGGECDMDIGNYERFLNKTMPRKNNITAGQIYDAVIQAERNGDYLGECVQIVPHAVNEIRRRILSAAKGNDVTVVECGGTVGDIESQPFLEAIRGMGGEMIHVVLVPETEEQKTKPAQHSLLELRRTGIQPDWVVVRSKHALAKTAKDKLEMAAGCDVASCPDVKSIYEVPSVLRKIMDPGDMSKWNETIRPTYNKTKHVAVIGKYVTLPDAYASIGHALRDAGNKLHTKINIDWIDSESLPNLSKYDGVLVPGGFGSRGHEGIIDAITYAYKNDVPYFGICFGFQLAVVALARLHSMPDAHTTEIDPDTDNPVVHIMPDKEAVVGNTLRLGTEEISISGGHSKEIYGNFAVKRHRHRYEVNKKYADMFEFVGKVNDRMEILEASEKRFFFATQFHPEFDTRPEKPEPAFLRFVSML